MRPLRFRKAAATTRATGRSAGWLAVALALTTGCGVVESTVCDEFPTPVSDDEPLPAGYTVQDLLDVAAPTAVPATWADGAETDLTVTVTRTGGTAEWVEAVTSVLRRPGGSPFGTTRTLEHVVCEDHVRFPVTLALDTADDRLSISEDVVARDRIPMDPDVDTDVLSFDVDADLRLGEAEGLPPLEEVLGPQPTAPERVLLTATFQEVADPAGMVMIQGADERYEDSDGDEVVSAWVAPLVEWGAHP